MILVSKILYLDHLPLLSKLFSRNPKNEIGDVWFNVGFPALTPPTLRGSMAIILNNNFLVENSEYFNYGSIIDLGGLEFGHIRFNQAPLTIKMGFRCDYAKFSKMLSDLHQQGNNIWQSVLHHRPGDEKLLDILHRHFPTNILSELKGKEDPHYWIYEFALQNGFCFKEHHVIGFYFPNTYRDISVVRQTIRILGDRAKSYNPKFGIESVLA
jgi:hypothetical protein